jgi:hypothetical protein
MTLFFEREDVCHKFSFWTYCATESRVQSTTFCATTMKKKLGRPKLPKEAAKGSVIRARVSDAEHAKIERAGKGGQN